MRTSETERTPSRTQYAVRRERFGQGDELRQFAEILDESALDSGGGVPEDGVPRAAPTR